MLGLKSIRTNDLESVVEYRTLKLGGIREYVQVGSVEEN